MSAGGAGRYTNALSYRERIPYFSLYISPSRHNTVSRYMTTIFSLLSLDAMHLTRMGQETKYIQNIIHSLTPKIKKEIMDLDQV